jgi:hypothetical protein
MTSTMPRFLFWVFWLAATAVLAGTPALVFLAGSADGVSVRLQVGLGAVGLAVAWSLLVLAARAGSSGSSVRRAVGRATASAVYAAVVFALAWYFASGPTFTGDTAWAVYWLASGAIWLALARRI